MLQISRRFIRLGCALAIACAVTACGGDDGNNNGGGGGTPTTVPNGSRLAWNQPASSLQQLQAMTFRLYVDGVLGAMTAVSCGTTASSGQYECAGRLPNMSPGRHAVELSAVLNGIEGARSEALSINIGAAIQGLNALVRVSGDQSGVSSVCINARDCYTVRLVAAGLGDTTSLARTPDGGVFFIEAGAQVRAIADDVLLAEAALVSPDSSGQLVGLAVDDRFAETRSVFVAWTESTIDGPRVNITRYREVAGSFGEGAAIVTGLPFRDGASAPLAVDREGLLYVALPSTSDVEASTQSAETGAGTVLRFTRDGQVPAANRAASPVFARGYANPSGLAVDTARGGLWLAGHEGASAPSVSMLSLSGGVRTAVPRMQSQIAVPSTEPSLAIFANGSGNVGPWLLVAADRQLLRGVVGSDGSIGDLSAVSMEALAPVRAVTGSRDSWYVAASAPDGSTSIFHLKRR